jgi:hypothetical protein
MTRLAGIIIATSFLLGCGVDQDPGPEVLPNLTIPAPPDHGVQIITPIVRDLAPSADKEMCTWTDIVTDHAIDVKSTLGYQVEPPGHHIVLFYTFEKQPPGTTRECTGPDMESFRFLAAAGKSGELKAAPGNLVFHVPAGAQLVVNHHYLNATDGTLDGQSVVNVNYADPGGDYVYSGNLAFVDTSIQVPEGQSSWNLQCTMEKSLKLWEAFPHMHQWGDHIKVDLTQAGQTTNLFDVGWDPSYQFEPPTKMFDQASPLVLDAGDTIAIQCDWNNDTGRAMAFGLEMCVMFATTIDDADQGSWQCNAGSWGPL